jgi:hypothetical protein
VALEGSLQKSNLDRPIDCRNCFKFHNLDLDREVIGRVSLAEDTVRSIYLTSHLAQSARLTCFRKKPLGSDQESRGLCSLRDENE